MRLRRKRRDKNVVAFLIAAAAVVMMLAVMISFISHVALRVGQMRGASQETLSSVATTSTNLSGHDERVRKATFTARCMSHEDTHSMTCVISISKQT